MLALYLHVSAGDWVYLPDEGERQEYVMNEEETVRQLKFTALDLWTGKTRVLSYSFCHIWPMF